MPNEIGWINGNLRINEIIIPWNIVTVELKQEGIAFYFSSPNILPIIGATQVEDTMLYKWEPDIELAEAVKDFILRMDYSTINLNPPFLGKLYYIVSKFNHQILGLSDKYKNEVIGCDKTTDYRPKWCLCIDDSGYYLIAYNNDIDLVLDIYNDSIYDEASIIVYSRKYANNYNQIWKLEPAENGYYYIVSNLSNKVLTLFSNGRVLQYEKQGYDTQKWRFEAG